VGILLQNVAAVVSFFLSFFFSSSPILSGRRLDVYHTSTYDVALANLECRSEMCCTRLAEIQDAKFRKESPSAHHRTTLSGYIFAIKAYIDNRKNLLNSNIFSTCTHNVVNFGPLTAEIDWRVWGTQQISTGFASWLRYFTDVSQRRSTKPCMMFGRLLGLYTMYTFWGLLPSNGILLGAIFTLRPSLVFSYIGSVTARHLSSGRQVNFAARYLHATGRPSCWRLAVELSSFNLVYHRLEFRSSQCKKTWIWKHASLK